MLGKRRAIDLDEAARTAPAVLVDDACHQALAGPGMSGQQHGHVERGHRGQLLEHPREGAAPTDELLTEQAAPDAARRIVAGLLAAPREQASDDRPEVTREDLRDLAIVRREGSPRDASLQVEDAERRTVADRRAQDFLDTADADALALAKARIQHRRRGHDRGAAGERLGDDAARYRHAHRLDLILEQAMVGQPTPFAAEIFLAVDLEEPVGGSTDLDDRGQRIGQEALEIGLLTEEGELAIQVALPADALDVRRVLPPRRGRGTWCRATPRNRREQGKRQPTATRVRASPPARDSAEPDSGVLNRGRPVRRRPAPRPPRRPAPRRGSTARTS